nr:uncharacterized protein LOC122321535 [Drosophila bipectinata]
MEGTTPDRILSRTLNILCGMCRSFFQSNDVIYNIGCGHLFHKTCLNTRPLKHPNCPQCGRPSNGSQQRIFLAFEEPSTVDEECLPYKWVPMKLGSNADGQLPPGAIECGTDDEGHKAYVARVIKGQELLPASYVPTKQAALATTCQVAYWLTEDVEVLVLENCYHKWVAGQFGSYPLDALETGYSDTGDVTYTGRAFFKGILRMGKVDPSSKTMSVAHRLDVEPNALPSSNQLPPGVVQCGTDDEGHTAYVARVIKGQELLPASYVPDKKSALASTCHKSYWLTENVEVLVLENCDHNWVDAHSGEYPPDALETGYSDTDEITYTGCCYFMGSLRIGKVHPSFRLMFVAHRAREECVLQYKVLVLTPRYR